MRFEVRLGAGDEYIRNEIERKDIREKIEMSQITLNVSSYTGLLYFSEP